MIEEAINIGEKNERISCILHCPLSVKEPKIIFVFIHGWAGYRIGPHQMFVKYARQLSDLGFYSLRFDFRGRGYSAGSRNETCNKSMLFDLEQIMLYLNSSIKYDKIILIGICSGAKLALFYAKNGFQKIDGVIELSSSLLRTDKETEIKINRKAKSISNRITKEKLLKLISGKVNFKKIIYSPIQYLIFLFNLCLEFFSRKAVTSNKSNGIIKKDSSFKNYFGKSFLLIHGEKDPETEVSLEQITSLLNKYDLKYDKHILPNANHSFYSIKWEKDIFEIIEKWLINNYNI
jgi:hypothetical protein